ncbi:glycine cleavage system protein GcvH [Williamsia sp. MIQD14]|uniref:Glycine cleavage system H protein n=1 Tax=Williamsia herbipolensis TaxID=1603258 RepID=A0AAU4K463_9NOCA|nr:MULTISPECIES: glycine cleavage system protein GcvH [Williamsia]KQR98461.1 glycine cleavage system protein H [Williamsia sp. Leaf354]MCX6470325.1 glycine cleavage system protein GcvH [Mycobacteriales bacterium]
MSETEVPENLRYTVEHEWIEQVRPGVVRVGITAYAQDQLGDVVFVQLPAVDDAVDSGESFAEVESTKSVSDIYGPLAGTIAAVNDDLDATPELVNSDPYGAGWLVEIAVAEDTDLSVILEDLLDADGYRTAIED